MADTEPISSSAEWPDPSRPIINDRKTDWPDVAPPLDEGVADGHHEGNGAPAQGDGAAHDRG